MKILFICSANKQRSKTADDYFSEKYKDHHFLSAGTNIKVCREEGTSVLTSDLLQWADKVYVMERKHLDQIQKRTGSTFYTKIEVLDIPDIYKYYDATLISLLEKKIHL